MINTEIQKLIDDAIFSINFQKREIVKYTLNLEVTPDSDWDRRSLETAMTFLKQAEHRLSRLTEMVNGYERTETAEINRFEVIDKTGRAMVSNVTSAKLSYQDGGQTLKIFLGE